MADNAEVMRLAREVIAAQREKRPILCQDCEMLARAVLALSAKRSAEDAVIAQARNVSPRICGAAMVLHEKLKELDRVQAVTPEQK